MICPFVTAPDLRDIWLNTEFVVVPNGGHSFSEPRICSAIISAINQIRDQLVVP